MTVDGGRSTEVGRAFDLFIRLRNTSSETWRPPGDIRRLSCVLCHPTLQDPPSPFLFLRERAGLDVGGQTTEDRKGRTFLLCRPSSESGLVAQLVRARA